MPKDNENYHYYAFTFEGSLIKCGSSVTVTVYEGLTDKIGDALLTLANLKYIKNKAGLTEASALLNIIYLGMGTIPYFTGMEEKEGD